MTVDSTPPDAPVVKDGSLPNKPGVTNWVEEAGGLPAYIRQVAEDLHTERGMSVSEAIATAVNKIKQWARGGGDTKPETKAKAAAALAQWTRMKVSKSADELPDEQFADLLVLEAEGYSVVRRGLSYMEKPHRFTPGPAGMCLFCSNSQRWHTENRPKTPAEVEQEKKDRAVQERNDDALGSALMLTPLPTEDDMLSAQQAEQKKIDLAGKVAGAPLMDPNDPKVAAGLAKAATFEDIVVTLIAKKAAEKKGAKADRPLVEVQYDPEKKAGGISEVERKKLADDSIAMEDGTFPIRDESDLKTALKFWGKATDPHAARDHIITRAKALGLTDLLPDNIKSAGGEGDIDVAKAAILSAITKYSASQPRDPNGRWKKAFAKWLADNFPGLVENPADTYRLPNADTDFRPSAGLYVTKAADYAVTKASEEKRYTLGPMYVPDRLDAHNEFTTADSLQKAVWDYVRAGDRQIRLQHNTDIVAGECVEVLSWPSEITADLALPGNGLRKSAPVTFPAGTTYMGIVWEPWAWEWVKKGKISGLSMGGFAKRVLVDLGADVAKAVEADTSVVKYSPSQPRNRKGEWTAGPSAASSLTPTSLPSVTGVISGNRQGDFVQTGRTTTSSGTPITHLTHVPSSTDGAETGRSDLSAIALAAATLSEQMGMSVESLLESVRRMLVRKHGQKGTPNYPHRPRGSKGSGGSDTEVTPGLANPSTRSAWTGTGGNSAESKGDKRTPISDADYEAHVARIDSVIAAHAEAGKDFKGPPLFSPNATYNLHGMPGYDNGSGDHYTPDRRAVQNAILDDILADAEARGVPKDRRGWIAGGLPGAGKTSYLKSESGKTIGIEVGKVDGVDRISNAVVINPDDIKVELIARGLGVEVEGLDPLETVAFLHEESSHVADRLAEEALALGFNVVYDITAHSDDSVGKRLNSMRAAGYEDVTYFLLDVSIQHSLDSAAKRHRAGLDRKRAGKDGEGVEERAEFGGRYVPAPVIMGNALDSRLPESKKYRSKMATTFRSIRTGKATDKQDQPIGYVPRMVLLDNEGYASGKGKPPIWDSISDQFYMATEKRERLERIKAASRSMRRP